MEKQKSQLLKKLWYWIKVASLLFALVGSIYLLYSWRSKEKELERLKSQLAHKEQKAQQQYQLQNNYLVSTTPLVNSPEVHSFFTDLLRNYAKKFARSKQIDISHYPLNFGGFYYGESQDQRPLKAQYQKLGNCCFTPTNQQTIISLNQFYLLNKLGYEKYFATPHHYLEINFANLLKTCSHELAHYIQFIKHGESSCESDLGTEKYVAELAKEHEKFTQEIYGMFNADYSYWEKQWKKI